MWPPWVAEIHICLPSSDSNASRDANNMEMHQVRYFLALSDTMNFTQAAERCNVTQPALTRAIRALEAELGGELLRRERALSHLTELGTRMVPLMRQCYESALAVRTIAQPLRKSETASLALAVSYTIMLHPIAPMLRELTRVFPGLQLKLRRGSPNEIGEFLKSGEVEMAIAGPLGHSWSRLNAFALFDEPFDVFVSRQHKFAGKHAIDFPDLAAETLLINSQCEMLDDLIACLRAGNVLDSRTHQVPTQENLLMLLEANLGIAIIPMGAVRSENLIRVPLTGLDLVRKVSAYCVAGRPRRSACTALLNMVRAADWSRELEVH